MIPMLVVWLGRLVLMALDGGRYHWSQVLLWLQVTGSLCRLLAVDADLQGEQLHSASGQGAEGARA
jgi:hypothetical protein